MVPHSRLRGIQQSADMLRKRSTLLKLEKKIFITIIFAIMCTMHWQQQCGCRQRCPQPRMDHLRQFQCNSFVLCLWTYCHCPVARFPQQGLGRQSKYGQRGGDLGGSTMANLVLSTCAFSPPDKVADSNASIPGPINIVDERVQGYWLGGSVGGVICPQPEVLIGTMGLWCHNDVQWLRGNNS
jgi:hypothetical protein